MMHVPLFLFLLQALRSSQALSEVNKDVQRELKPDFMDWISECMLHHGIGVFCIGKLLDRPVSSAALGFILRSRSLSSTSPF